MIKPQFIYFDLDDTLLDHKKAELGGLRDVHAHFDVFSDIDLSVLTDTYHHINKGLWEEYGKGEIDRHELHRRRFEETFQKIGVDSALYEEAGKVYMQFYRNHWEWIEGAKDAFELIRENYAVGIITNGFAETQWLKIKKFGFEEVVDHIVISEEIGVMKPHQKIFDHSTELTGIERENILYVGDSPTSDVVGGKRAGWKVAWYTKTDKNPVSYNPDLKFSEFDELLKYLNIY